MVALFLEQLNSVFRGSIPAFILINFLVLIFLIYSNRKDIKKFLLLKDKVWVLLILIFLLGLILRIYIPEQQHILYIDEQWYMEAGKNMLHTGSQMDYRKSIGWPFVIAISFILGVNNYIAIYTSILLGALTCINIFFIAHAISNNKELSLLSAFTFSILPSSILWSSTAETAASSLFFVTLAIFFCMIYYKTRKNTILYLCIAALSFASQFRIENYIYFILFLVGCWIFSGKKCFNTKFFIGLMIAVLAIPNLIQVAEFQLSENWVESDSGGAMTGDNFSLDNLVSNSITYGKYLFNGTFQPILFSILFLIGVVYMFFKGKKAALFLSAWFVMLWIIYFGAWFQILGSTDYLPAKTRFFIAFYPAILIFFGYGVLFFWDKVFKRLSRFVFPAFSIAIAVLFIPYVAEAGEMFSDDNMVLETQIPEMAEKDIPAGCIIVANWPTILKSTTELNVIDLPEFLDDRELQDDVLNNSCALFFEELTCELWQSYKEKCIQIKREFVLKNYKEYSYGNSTYTFYQLVKRI